MEAEKEYCSSSVKSSWGTVSCYYERDQLSKLDTMQWRMKRDLGSGRGDLWQSMRVYSVAAKSAATNSCSPYLQVQSGLSVTVT